MKAKRYKKGIAIRAKSHTYTIVANRRVLIEGNYQQINWIGSKKETNNFANEAKQQLTF